MANDKEFKINLGIPRPAPGSCLRLHNLSHRMSSEELVEWLKIRLNPQVLSVTRDGYYPRAEMTFVSETSADNIVEQFQGSKLYPNKPVFLEVVYGRPETPEEEEELFLLGVFESFYRERPSPKWSIVYDSGMIDKKGVNTRWSRAGYPQPRG